MKHVHTREGDSLNCGGCGRVVFGDRISILKAAMLAEVHKQLGPKTTVHAESDGTENHIVVCVPSVYCFKAKDLQEAIDMAKRWKDGFQ